MDFVLQHGARVVPVEVKSTRTRGAAAALGRFSQMFGAEHGLIVGSGCVPLEVFLVEPASAWC